MSLTSKILLLTFHELKVLKNDAKVLEDVKFWIFFVSIEDLKAIFSHAYSKINFL